MIQRISRVYLFAGGLGQKEVHGIGNNHALTFTYTSAGGGQWRSDKSPMIDKMRVLSFAGTVLDTNSMFCPGARIGLGLLTGDQNNPLHWLAFGCVGTRGDMWVRIPYPIKSDYGLCFYVPDGYPTADWYFKTDAVFETGKRGP